MSVGVYISGMKMPKSCHECVAGYGGCCFVAPAESDGICPDHGRADFCPLIPVPDHGRLIDADALRQAMYHEAFETDSPMQKWDSGCWIRYKMFEQMEESAPTIIPASTEDKEDK